MIELSIIIVAYHAPEYVKRCLASIPKKKNWETIVIDNTRNNRGFARACNLGARQAQGKYLLFLNPDSEVLSGSVEKLMQAMDADPGIGIIGPQLIDDDDRPYLSTTQQPRRLTAPIVYSVLDTCFPRNRWSRAYWYRNRPLSQEAAVGSVSGAALMIRAGDFAAAGGFDERLFMYWEDYDLCRRIKATGKEVRYYPKARIRHSRAKSTDPKNTRVRSWFRWSRLRFFWKHFGLGYALALETWLVLQEEWRLFAILMVAAWLRFDRITTLSPLLPDQAYDYWSAWNSVTTKHLPLLGIPSSLPRFHQGPLYVWFLAVIFSLFGPGVVAPAMAAAMTGLVTVWVTYVVAERRWSRNVAAIAALIMATSPLAVAHARMAFMVNPIPLLSLLYLWVLGRPYRRPRDVFWVTLGFALLFQFELAVFPLLGLAAVYLWENRRRVVSWRRVTGALAGGLAVGLWPQIAYDLTHGFTQIGLFLGWVGYRMVRFTGLFPGRSHGLGQLGTVGQRFLEYLGKFSAWGRPELAWILMAGVLVAAGYYLRGLHRRRPDMIRYPLLWIGLLVAGFSVHGAPSEAYFPALFVPLALVLGWMIFQTQRPWRLWLTGAVVVVAGYNAWFTVTHEYVLSTPANSRAGIESHYGPPLQTQVYVVDTIKRLTADRDINPMEWGPGSEFPSALANYRWLMQVNRMPVDEAGLPVWFLTGDPRQWPTFPNAYVTEIDGITLAVERPR